MKTHLVRLAVPAALALFLAGCNTEDTATPAPATDAAALNAGAGDAATDPAPRSSKGKTAEPGEFPSMKMVD